MGEIRRRASANWLREMEEDDSRREEAEARAGLLQNFEFTFEEELEIARAKNKVPEGLNPDQILGLASYFGVVKGKENPQCSICSDMVSGGERVITANCGHTHHLECISRWLVKTGSCPLCRSNL